MSDKIKKRFGVWMGTHHATIIGYAPPLAEGVRDYVQGHLVPDKRAGMRWGE